MNSGIRCNRYLRSNRSPHGVPRTGWEIVFLGILLHIFNLYDRRCSAIPTFRLNWLAIPSNHTQRSPSYCTCFSPKILEGSYPIDPKWIKPGIYTSRCKPLLILAIKHDDFIPFKYHFNVFLPILGIILYIKGIIPRSLVGTINTHLQWDAKRWCKSEYDLFFVE